MSAIRHLSLMGAYGEASRAANAFMLLEMVSTQLQQLGERILVERGLPSPTESWRLGVSDFAGAESGVLGTAS